MLENLTFDLTTPRCHPHLAILLQTTTYNLQFTNQLLVLTVLYICDLDM